MSRYLDDFMKGHNIKFSIQQWKKSQLLIVVAFVTIAGLVFLLVTGGEKTVDVNDAKSNFKAGDYAQAAENYEALLLQEQSTKDEAELLLAQGQSLLYSGDTETALTVLKNAKSVFKELKDSIGEALANKYILEGSNMQDTFKTNQPDKTSSDGGLNPEEMIEITKDL